MIIYRQQILEEDLELTGEVPADVFQLNDKEIRNASPISYHLHASLQENDLLVNGWISASFQLRCVRCLDFFEKTIHVDPYALLEPFENQTSIDLTERLREDILLGLSGYPRCEMADSPRECGPFGEIQSENAYQSTQKETTQHEKEVWSALDKLNPPKNPDSKT
jgi:uncharacterized metal-binding protein YceD (DUF177 family)